MTRESESPRLSRRDFLARSAVGGAAIASGALAGGAIPALAGASELQPIFPSTGAQNSDWTRAVLGARRAREGPAQHAAQRGADGLRGGRILRALSRWTFPYAKGVRTQLDDLGLRCHSTHNSPAAVLPGDTMTRAIELNQILGARHIILASPPANTTTLEDWKRVSGQLSSSVEQLKPHGLTTDSTTTSSSGRGLPADRASWR